MMNVPQGLRVPEESWACGPPKVMKNAFCPATTFHGSGTVPFVIPSSRLAEASRERNERDKRELCWRGLRLGK